MLLHVPFWFHWIVYIVVPAAFSTRLFQYNSQLSCLFNKKDPSFDSENSLVGSWQGQLSQPRMRIFVSWHRFIVKAEVCCHSCELGTSATNMHLFILWTDDGTPREVVVEIERSTRHKPFLGGYRHRLTGVEFHHASSQTRSKTRPDNGIPKFCRDTQTVSQKNKTQQATRHTSTQMTKIGCYVSNMPDKLYTPGRYTTADEFHHTRLKAVRIIRFILVLS